MQHLPLVVLIEPEWPARSFVRAELEELGYEVVAHERARDAVATLERWGLRPQVIVADLVPDGHRGAELRALLERYPEASLVLLASPLRAVPRWAVERASTVLRRPFSVREVIEAVRKVTPPTVAR